MKKNRRLEYEKEQLQQKVLSLSGITKKSMEPSDTVGLRLEHGDLSALFDDGVELDESDVVLCAESDKGKSSDESEVDNKRNKSYPAKSYIDESNIFNLLIKDCLPYDKYVFSEDIVGNIGLDLSKLNGILIYNYSVGPITKNVIASMTVKRFKEYLLELLFK